MSAAKVSLSRRFAAMTRRERLTILLAGVATIGLLGSFYVVEPQKAKWKRSNDALQVTRLTAAQLLDQSTALSRTLAQDINAEPRARAGELRKKVADLDESLRNLQRGLVAPQRMAALLEDLLNRDGRLKLLSLRTLPVGPLVDETKGPVDASAKTTPAAVQQPVAKMRDRVFKHGVEVTVQGSYGELLGYLGQLEKLPVQMFWAATRMDAKDYPRVTLTLTLYTLSLDQTWLVL